MNEREKERERRQKLAWVFVGINQLMLDDLRNIFKILKIALNLD